MRILDTAGLAGLLALAAACGGGGHELKYGAAVAPTTEEQLAATDAQSTLDLSRTFAPSSEPGIGAPGLADQLVGSLGGTPAPVASLPHPVAARATRALGRAAALPASTVTLDPSCVTTTATSVTWRACVATVSELDPYSGDTTDMTVHVDGRLGWIPATGETSWDIVETIAMVMTSAGDVMRLDATAHLAGALTLTTSSIKGQTSSSVNANVTYGGISAREAVTTSLVADLAYAADPFCLTGGTLTVAQVWTRRPTGMTAADLPDQGWRFEWAGCGLFTVAHGS